MLQKKVNTSPEIGSKEFASFEIGSRKLPAVGKVHSIQTLVDNVVLNEHTKVTATHTHIICIYKLNLHNQQLNIITYLMPRSTMICIAY